MHTNLITDEYIDHIEKIKPELISGIAYTRTLNINLLKKQVDKATIIKTNFNNFASYPKTLQDNSNGYLEKTMMF